MKKILLLCITLVTVGCGQQPVGSISVEMLEDMIKKGTPLVDIRTPQQWEKTGVIPGSHLITVFDANNRFAPDVFDRIAEAAGGKEEAVILLSQTGRRSGEAVRIMTGQLGFTDVYHAASGISGWEVHKLPLISPADNP